MASDITITGSAAPELGTPIAAKRWQAPAADLARAQAGPVRAVLPDVSVLDIEGPDAVAFLQGQTTSDIAGLGPGSFAIGGYCSPKGRLLAIFRAWRTATGVRLLLPREIAEPTRKRLSMFVLRAKLRLADVSASWQVLGICGPGSVQALAQAGVVAPEAPGRCSELAPGELVARLESGAACPERLLLVVAADAAPAWERRLEALAPVDAGVWWWSGIDAAVPDVFEATRECFVPQAVNLELLGGVNFRKGCYPGQEIVARSQYLGKLRRRMGIAHAPAIGPDGDIYHRDDEGSDAGGSDDAAVVGRIVMAAAAPGGGWDLLYECPTERTERGSLHAGGRDAPALALRPLPYPIFDPTA